MQIKRRLVTGSRDATKDMLEMASVLVAGCIAGNHMILVGDADGIDNRVIAYCNEKKYERIMVFGWGGLVRRRTRYGSNIIVVGDPLERNRVMAKLCDDCTAIWNGISPSATRLSGTRRTFEYVYTVMHKPITVFNVKTGEIFNSV